MSSQTPGGKMSDGILENDLAIGNLLSLLAENKRLRGVENTDGLNSVNRHCRIGRVFRRIYKNKT